MTDDASPENLRKFLESDDPAMVRMGLSMAKGSGVPDEILEEILWMYMFHDDKTIRAAAKSAFIKLAPEDAKQTVKDNWKASYRAHWYGPQLGILGKALCQTSVSLVGRLIKAIGDKYRIERRHDGMKVRYYISPLAAQALGIIGDERAVKPLIKALKDDNEYKSGALYFKQLSNYAADALGGIGKPAVEPLIEALGDENSDVRRYAAKALDKLGWKPETDGQKAAYLISNAAWGTLVELGEPAVEPLIKALGTEEGNVRKSAAGALDKLGWVPETDGQRAAYLIAVEDWKSLVECGEPTVEPLIGVLSDGNSDFRRSAAEALGEIGDGRAVEPLIKALSDGRWAVRRAIRESATGALGKIGKPAVEPLIKALLGSEDEWVRMSAAEALGEIGGVRAVEVLIKALGDDDVCSCAAEALGEIGDARAVEPLIGVLSDKEEYACEAAAKALGKIGKPAVESLIGVLLDYDMGGRGSAARALDELGWVPETDGQRAAYLIASRDWESLVEWGEPAVEPLIKALGDDDQWVREAAVYALGEIGDERAVEPLIKALGDEEDNVRSADALKMFGVQGLQGFITAGKGNELTVSELKMILKEKELPTSGTKALLIQRIMDVK